MTLTIATSATIGIPTIMTKTEKPECLNKRVQTTNSLRKDLRKAKEKLQTELGFLRWELGITWYRVMDTKRELEEAQQELENAHWELENSRQEIRNTQWAHEYTQWQQVRTPPACPIEGTTTSSTAPEWIILSP
ncbi:hypothetical protein EI94DRAFT_1703850 [Lactarius quietus]|nr:hypothetical protein EI94DRAFT_1703850 [Lactarius quietus]